MGRWKKNTLITLTFFVVVLQFILMLSDWKQKVKRFQENDFTEILLRKNNLLIANYCM